MGHGGVTAVFVISTGVLLGGPAAAQTGEPDSIGHLKDVCALSHNTSEPICPVPESLTQDQAWLVLRTACAERDNAIHQPCKDFYAEHGGVLLYDFRRDRWDARWESKNWDLKFDVAGVPTVRLKPRDAKPLKIVATNISPLTYSAAPGTPKEEDLAVIAGLKTFLALAGTGIQGLIQTVTFSAAAGAQPLKPSPQPDTRGLRESADFFNLLEPKEACLIDGPDVTEVAGQVAERNRLLADLNAELRDLEIALGALDTARTAFLAAVQDAEDGKEVRSSTLWAPATRDLEAAYTSFESSAATLTASTDLLAPCQRLLAAYSAVLAGPPNSTVLNTLVRQVDSAPACPLAVLNSTIRTNAHALVPACTPDKATLDEAVKLHAAAMKPLVDRLLNARQVEEKVWQAIDKGRTAKTQVLSGAATLNRQVLRGLHHTWKGKLIRELVVTRQNPGLPWNKLQTHTLVLTADSPYVKEVTLARSAEQKRDYKLESAAGQLLGYGIGVIYTPLHESTWTAAAAKPPADGAAPATPATKVITETKRETRAGDLAAFLTYRPLEHRPAKRIAQPTLDLGVGLTSDRAAFFLGAGLEVRRAARISAGWAPQRISMLDAGQTVNETIVTSNDDIRTVKRFQTKNWYVSFSFALDALSLFNKP